jgi:hypothetical protein
MSKRPRTIPISLTIDDLGDGFYDEVLEAFKHHIARMELDPNKFFYDQWRITCVAEEWVRDNKLEDNKS